MKISLLLLKNKAKGLIFRTCFVLFITIALFLMIDLLAFSHFYKYKSFSSTDGYGILFEGETDFENAIIYCDNGVLCYLTDQSETPMGLEVCMQSPSSLTFENYINEYYDDILGNSEIVISKTTATRFSLAKGDTVYLERGDSINRYAYSIKDIIEDIPSVFGASDRYVAIIGYSQKYCDNVRYKTLVFYDGEMKDLEFGANYIQHIAFKEEAIKELTYFLAFLAVYVVLLCAVLLFVMYEQNVDITNKELKFEHVDFSYEDSKPILHDINVQAKPNTVVAFAGPSGGGKSTIFSLIERFYKPTAGEITIGGENIDEISLENWRKQIGLVGQNSAVMPGTIRENLLYGLEREVSDDELWQALDMAYAKNFVQEMDDQLDTQIGERGIKLSGGQRQRIAIARAFLRNPKILMLDEATASLDSESEAMVQKALSSLMKDRTTLVIAHCLSTIVDADTIYFIDHGTVSGSGKHEELIKSTPLYAEYVKNQFKK